MNRCRNEDVFENADYYFEGGNLMKNSLRWVMKCVAEV
jgi:hypothetical protein